jgi:hypothetical protein
MGRIKVESDKKKKSISVAMEPELLEYFRNKHINLSSLVNKLWSILKRDIIRIIASKYNYNLFIDDTLLNVEEVLSLINENINIIPILAIAGNPIENIKKINFYIDNRIEMISRLQRLRLLSLNPTLDLLKLTEHRDYELLKVATPATHMKYKLKYLKYKNKYLKLKNGIF